MVRLVSSVRFRQGALIRSEDQAQQSEVTERGAVDLTWLPLSALASQALVAFVVELDNEFEHQMPHRTTNLLHYPMISHRGGFPDGS
jgi:hypothetical protein